MLLKNLTLQNFRNYSKATFDFSPTTTIIIGPNAIGKTNIIEAIYMLSTGKSFRTDKDKQVIKFGQNLGRVKGFTEDELEVVFSELKSGFFQKKYLINGVSRRRSDFAKFLSVVLFTPTDLDLVSGQPGVRRRFLDEVLLQSDSEYHRSHIDYAKALRQRNALLERAREEGARSEKEFSYWDELLIKNGQYISKKRNELINFINEKKKKLFEFELTYDLSEISKERLLQYKNAEIGSGVTLVGPHRDDMLIKSENKLSSKKEEAKYFGSRGQQRLVALELKLAQIENLKKVTDNEPLLLLDDVFSELDESNIEHVLDLMNTYQTIATTTHEEFVEKNKLDDVKMIELGKEN